MTLKQGELLNYRYRIIKVLGQGGMGSIYRARDEHLDINVAVKENLYLSDEYTRQFKREANILAQLRHQNLPRVGDYFYIKGQGQYLIMDFIEGEDLRERIERIGKLPEKEVVKIGASICLALSYLHSREAPIVHRDLKPGNIKISPEGNVFLVDFGLAKRMQGTQVTTTGARAMTPGYSPPEQYGTARTDPRSDIYSLGATLYAAETGAIPEDALERMTGKAKLTNVRSIRPKATKKLAEAIEKSLSIEPEERFQTADEFREHLLNAMGFESITNNSNIVEPPPRKNGNNGIINGSIFEHQKEVIEDNSKEKNSTRQILIKVSIVILIIGFLSMLGAYLFFPSKSKNVLQNTFYSFSTGERIAERAEIWDSDVDELISETKINNPTDSIFVSRETKTEIPTISKTPLSIPEINLITKNQIEELAFVSDRTGELQIWIMDENGENETQVTSMPGGVCQPDWSPDGNSIAFISPCKDKSRFHYEDSKIYIMNYETGEINLLEVSKEGDFDPAWSPEGDRILFTSLRSGTSHIYLYNFKENTLEELSDTRYADMQPSWNPSGKQIAFVREIYFKHIWIMSDKGQTQFQYSPNGAINDLWPIWTDDGDILLYSKLQDSPAIPWLVAMNYEDRNTAAEYRIPQSGIDDPGPVARAKLSSRNQWIAYESWPDGKNHDIYRMDFDGNNQLRLTTDPGFETDPNWRPQNLDK